MSRLHCPGLWARAQPEDRLQGPAFLPRLLLEGANELRLGNRDLRSAWKTLHRGGISWSFLNPGQCPNPGAQNRSQGPPQTALRTGRLCSSGPWSRVSPNCMCHGSAIPTRVPGRRRGREEASDPWAVVAGAR